MQKKYLNKQLLTIGAGTLGAMFAGATASNMLSSSGNELLSKYAVPVSGLALLIAGSMLMSSGGEAKKAGMGVGGVGVSILGNEGYKLIRSGMQGTPKLDTQDTQDTRFAQQGTIV